jgi:DNA-directed RNA polymerase subunit RPC12/RpoP
VKAENPFDACQKLGFTDYNKHFAKEIVDMNKHSDGIKKERKHLNTVSKQLNEMIKERDAEIESFKKNRPCPNCGKKMDMNYVCAACGFGVDEPNEPKD